MKLALFFILIFFNLPQASEAAGNDHCFDQFGTKMCRTADWFMSGGSKADGIVEMSYELNPWGWVSERPPHQKLGFVKATLRCYDWDYKGAAPLEKETLTCITEEFWPGSEKSTRCVKERFTTKFQCTTRTTQTHP